jgi:hypothetical protein
LYNQSTAFGQRPSAILGIDDDWLAYDLDQAVLLVGRWIENRLARRNKKGKRIWTLEQLLAEKGAPKSGQFRDPRLFVRRKVKIPESGIW